jgi:MFS family permease
VTTSPPGRDVAPRPARASGAARLLLAIMWGAYFLNYCDRQAVFAMFPALEADLAMSDRELGYVGAVFLWVYALGCPLAGVLGDRVSKRLLAVGSLVVWSLVTLATGWARSGTDILALRGAMGISESLFMPTAIALTADAHPPTLRSRAIAILTTAQIAGTVAGSVFGGRMADAGRWRDAFFMLGLVGVAYAVPYFFFLRQVGESPAETPSAGPFFRPVRSLFGAPSFLVLCAVFPCFVFGLWLIYGWLPTFLHDKFALSQADAAWNATAYLQSATAIGLLGGGSLSDWLYRRTAAARQWVLAASLVCSAPCLYLIGAAETLPATRLAAAVFGLSSGLFMGNIFAAGFEVVPAGLRATAVGILNLFGGTVSGFATLFGGMWKQTLGIDGLLAAAALAALAAAALLALVTWACFDTDRGRATAEAIP